MNPIPTSDFQSVQWFSFIIKMHLSCMDEKMWILISWLLVKPADLDLHFFKKRVQNFEKMKLTSHLLEIEYRDLKSVNFLDLIVQSVYRSIYCLHMAIQRPETRQFH